MRTRRTLASLVALGATAAMLAACSSSSSDSSTSSSAPATSAAASAAASASAEPSAAASGATAADAAAMLPQRYKDKGEIDVASDIPYPPMELLAADGTVSGVDYDLSQALGEVLGVKVSFNKQAWDSIIPSLQSGKHDVIMSGMNDTLEREKVLDFVNYFDGGFALLVPKGNPEGITGLADLCGKTVAEETAVAQIDLIKAASANCPSGQEITILQLPTDGDAQNAVRAGKASADLLDAAVAAYSAQTAGDGQYFEVVHDAANPQGISPVLTGIGVLKKDNDLALALQAALQTLIDNGTYQQILDKYEVGAYAVPTAQLNGATS
ncbi:MAG: ABC transporter substrate-binding protein [Candidatus Nanopelagicales bacterium]|jgi:polar amino acid transport system substrate-binding protein